MQDQTKKPDLIRIDGTPWRAGRLRSAFESVSVRAALFGIAVLTGFGIVQTHSLPIWAETLITVSSIVFIAGAGWVGRKLEIDMCEIFHEKAAPQGIHPSAQKNFPDDRSDGFLDHIRDLRIRCGNEVIESGFRLAASIPAGAVTAAAAGWNITAFSLMPTLVSIPGFARSLALHRRCKKLLKKARANGHADPKPS